MRTCQSLELEWCAAEIRSGLVLSTHSIAPTATRE
jgi:hypothetical protein